MQLGFVLRCAAACLAIVLGRGASAHDAVQTKFTVMSRNVYVGADLTQLIGSDLDEIFDNMRKVFKRVKKTDFEKRAQALADEIEASKPLLIGLQEVALWRTDDSADGPFSDAHDVAFDFLDILLEELASRDLNYEPLVVFNGFDIEAPGNFSSGLKDVRFTDRDVILGRVNHHFDFYNPKKHRFDDEFGIPGFGFFGDLTYKRAWQSVDVKVVGSTKKFRFINTHLEVLSGSVNESQAQELIDDPADVSRPVIIVGDMNAAPDDPFTDAYDRFIDAGFVDVWEQEHPGSNGFTCCQNANLQNNESNLSRRIDFVFVRGAIDIRAATIVGEDENDQLSNGLWPSDHAGVVAKLTIE